MKYILLLIPALAIACTTADRGKIMNLGGSANIKCWSGDTIIYNGTSDGKVRSEEGSDGYYFIDKSTGDLMEVSGNCVLTYK